MPAERTPSWAKVIIALLVAVVVLLLLPWAYMLTMMVTHGFMPMSGGTNVSGMAGGMMDNMHGMMGR